MLRVSDFPTFFRELHGGAEPYSWQLEVLEQVVNTGQWPGSIVAPTGSGKSAVAHIHVFARALAVQDGLKVPRRLVLVVGRRALVDAQAKQARLMQEMLTDPSASPTMRSVSELLARESLGISELLGVSVIRGGVTPDRGWIDHPTLTQILCMTPDMVGSRLLHHGYGEAQSARPRSAGLLAFDTAIIIDESHLNVQLMMTVRRVREIVQGAPASASVLPVQIVETTATPQPRTPAGVVVNEAGLDIAQVSDQSLQARLKARKSLRLVGLDTWPLPRAGAARKSGIAAIVSNAIEVRAGAGGTVGVILNRVADAATVAEQLTDAGYQTVLRVGPMRPLSGMRAEREYPELLTQDGDPRVDFLIATQTIEVGVDLDLHGMVTEIASAPAIVQRLGRVNRRGQQDDAHVVIVGPVDPIREDTDPSPYTQTEIREAAEWLSEISRDSADLSPSSIARTTVPPSSQRRLIYERLTLADAELLSHTREDIFTESELDVWLDDEIGAVDRSAGVIGRVLPSEPGQRLPLLQITPPQDHEVYPTTIARLRRGFADAKKRAERSRSGPHGGEPVAYIWRDSEWLAWDSENQGLRPGDVVCFDYRLPSTMEGVFLPEAGSAPLGDSLSAWLDEPELSGLLPWPRQKVIMEAKSYSDDAQDAPVDDDGILLYQISQILKEGEEADLDLIQDRMIRAGHSKWLENLIGAEFDSSTLRLDHAAPNANGGISWAVLTLESGQFLAEESRQEWSSAGRVLLEDHQHDVEERAALMAKILGLPQELSDAIAVAARHHDDGKAHPSFQARLGNRSLDGPHLAKSGRRKNLSRSRTGSDGLPVGWRHEQYSVLLNAAANWQEKNLILRLIGTTHGHGRSMFIQSAEQLCTGLSDSDLLSQAQELFVEGGWDELMERTGIQHRWWGASYLEALLRAADCQVSKEGR